MEFLLTQEELEKLRKKEEALLKEKEEIILKLKEISKESVDVINDLEYRSLRRRLFKEIPDKIADIKRKISMAKIVEEEDITFDGMTVGIGTKVVIEYDGKPDEFSILAVCENDDENDVVSSDAPIAKTILGKKKGEKVPFRNGFVTIIDVLKI